MLKPQYIWSTTVTSKDSNSLSQRLVACIAGSARRQRVRAVERHQRRHVDQDMAARFQVKEHGVEKGRGVLDVLDDVEQDDDVIALAKLGPLFQDVVIEHASHAEIAAAERLEVEVGAVEHPRMSSAAAADS